MLEDFTPHPPQNQIYPDQALPPIKVKELNEKTALLVEEYRKVLETNQKLKSEIEDLEKKKMILSRPGYFELEMVKMKMEINTYLSTLQELETNAQMTFDVLEGEHSQ